MNLVTGTTSRVPRSEWVAQMLGHTTPEMLFTVYIRYIPKRTRRDGSAFASRMSEAALPEAQKALAVIPK